MFGTNDGFTPWNVPSFRIKGGVASSPSDALPVVPRWSDGLHIWAPTVDPLGPGWLMLFGASRSGGRLCIGAALASDLLGAFSATGFRLCSEDLGWGGRYGLLDPDLYLGPGGPLLVFSRQTGGTGSGQSDIMAVPFHPGSLAVVGPARRLLSFDEARSVPGVGAAQLRGLPEAPAVIENPHLLADPYNQGGLPTLLFSMGAWRDQGSGYATVEVPCTLSRCIPGLGVVMLRGIGGVSSSGTSAASPGLIIGHRWRDGHRWPILLQGRGFTRPFG